MGLLSERPYRLVSLATSTRPARAVEGALMQQRRFFGIKKALCRKAQCFFVVPCRTQHSMSWDAMIITQEILCGVQCRTQHSMCWDSQMMHVPLRLLVSMPHAAFYVLGLMSRPCIDVRIVVSMPHAAFYVLGLPTQTFLLSVPCFNAARIILCLGTLSSPALVPSGLRSHFGKSSVFRADFAAKMRSPNGKSRGRSPLLLVRRGLRRFGKSER